MSLVAAPNADVAGGSVFGQTMGLVAATLGFLTLGAYLGRHLGGGVSILCCVIGFFCLVGLNYVRGAGGAAAALMFATGLFLGLGLAGGLDAFASAGPDAVWQSAAATALFVSMPAGNVIYAGLGLVIFGGYTVLDFNRLRQSGGGDAPSIAAGIFLDVLNVFTFFLQLFGRGRD